MAEVWLAEDQRLGRWVALKLLREGFGTEQDGDLVQSFEREARVVAQLQHPNIVAVYDAGTYEGRYYLVMEYVHGHSLREILDAQGRLREADVLHYGIDSAAALQYAHDHAVIHCDVKPENILITEDGTPKLADFGVAETATRTLSPEQAKDILGTIAYLAPEVIQGSGADPRSDVYSLAMTLYESVAGRLPFAGTNPAALAGQRLATPAPPVRSFARDVSPELELVLSRGLSLSPHDRYQTAAEFGAALRDVPARSSGLGAAAGAATAIGAGSAAASRRAPVEPDTPLRQRHPTARVSRRVTPPQQKSGVSGAALAMIIAVVFVALGLGLGVAALISQGKNNSGGSTPTPRPSAHATTAATPTSPPATAVPATATKAATATPSPVPSPSPSATQPPETPTKPAPTATKPPPTATKAAPTATQPPPTVVVKSPTP